MMGDSGAQTGRQDESGDVMRLRINDGYTLADETKPTDERGNTLPILRFEYRPALPDAIYEWQYDTLHARSGTQELTAAAKLLESHLVKWDAVLMDDEKREVDAPLTAEVIRQLPNPILQQLLAAITTFSLPGKDGKSQKAEAEGNSRPG